MRPHKEFWVWLPNDQLPTVKQWCEHTLGNRAVGEHPWEIKGYDSVKSVFTFHTPEGYALFMLVWSDKVLDVVVFD